MTSDIAHNIDELRATFLQAYYNVPLDLRRGVILVIQGEGITWHSAYIEIVARSPRYNKILISLSELGII
jgi:hypothetical protein